MDEYNEELKGDQGIDVAGAFMQMLDILGQVRNIATAERKNLVEDGWSEEAAEEMAGAAYVAVLNMTVSGARSAGASS